MYQKIVVPLDGSTFAEQALPTAVDLAETSDGAVHLIMVLDGHLESAFREMGFSEHITPLEAAQTHLEGQRILLGEKGVKATATMVTARGAAEEIVREAEDVEADVIVMTTHGRSGLQRWLLGSVAEKVLRTSTVPVLLVPVRET